MIRNVKISDYKDIAKICKNDLGYDADELLVKSRIENLDSNREAVFVAFCDKKAVGFVHCEIYNTLYFESLVNIQGLAVSSEYRRKGFGRELMNSAEEWAKQKGIYKIRLNSGLSRKDAHTFYRHLGYGDEKQQIRFMKDIKNSDSD